LLDIEERIGSVPLLVESMVDYLTPRADEVSADLFKTHASAAAVLSVKSTLEQGQNPGSLLGQCSDVHVAATVLKKFLLDLPEPVCTAAALDSFLAAAESATPAAELRPLVDSLPPANETLLRHLIAFLKVLSQHQDETRLTAQVLAESFGTSILRGLSVYPGDCSDETCCTAAKAVAIMMEDSDTVFQDPPLLKAPVFKDKTWKLLLVGRLLRVTPDDIERKLAILTEIKMLKEKLTALKADVKSKQGGSNEDQEQAVSSQMTKHMEHVASRLMKLEDGFYQMEIQCGPPNMSLEHDTIAPQLLREVSDHLDILKQEEINMRTAFRKGLPQTDRPMVDSAGLRELLKTVGDSVGLGDELVDSEDMFHELWFLRGEEARPYTLPEFLDVVGKWMELKGLFRMHDKYKNGHILIEDVLKSMQDFGALWGYRPTPLHFIQLLHEFDIDARHGIIWEEFRMLMHRWIEEKKRGYDIGKDRTQVETVRSSEVLVDQLKQELKCIFLKFESCGGGIDILCLGGIFEEICHAFELGGTLSDLYRLLRVMETSGIIQWDMFVGVMSKWIILKQLFTNYSKDGGKTVGVSDLEYPLTDLRSMWGCFDPRHGNRDVAVLAKELGASVNTPSLTFEEFLNGLRFQVALKSIFELHDVDGCGLLSLASTKLAIKAAEDYSGVYPACSNTLLSLGSGTLDEDITMSWPEFLVTTSFAIGDEFDASS